MKSPLAFLVLVCLPVAPLLGQTTDSGGTSSLIPTGTTQQGTTSPTGSTGGTTGSPSSGPSSNPSTPDLSVPVDKSAAWVVGFSAFTAEGLSPENQYLCSSIPLLLKNELAGITTHDLSPRERDLVRTAAINREIDAVDKTITSLRQQRDALYLDTSPPSASTLAGIDTRIAAAQARKTFLKSMDISRVTVADQKPLVVKDGSGAGKLFDAPQYPAAVFCARQGLDVLIGGTLREVEGYILIDAWACDALRGEMAFTARDASLREEIYAALPGFSQELSGLFLGRPWASIAFSPDPPDSSLFVDDKLVATGKTPVLYLSPGTRAIRVSAPGYRDISETLSLKEEEQASLEVTLQKENGGTIVISSTPAGADVYQESVWKGKTPLALEKPFERTRIVLSKSGFYDEPFSVSAASPSDLSFTLQPDIVSRDAIQKKARDEFYTSFAFFALSLPIPFFCYAFALDEAMQVQQLAQSGSYAQVPGAQALGNALYTGYIVGTVVSVGLFTWMLFKIIHYVSVSTRTEG